jgi:hypothetical protein
MELLANAYGLPDDGSVYGILYAWFPADPQSRADKIEQATVQWTQHCSSTALNEGTCEMTLQRVAPPPFFIRSHHLRFCPALLLVSFEPANARRCTDTGCINSRQPGTAHTNCPSGNL